MEIWYAATPDGWLAGTGRTVLGVVEEAFNGLTSPPLKPIASLHAFKAFLTALPAPHMAVRIYNAQQALSGGALLTLPRDAARLETAEVLERLPGLLTQMLAEEQAHTQQFRRYLRKGAPPVLSADHYNRLRTGRPCRASWQGDAERERLLKAGRV